MNGQMDIGIPKRLHRLDREDGYWEDSPGTSFSGSSGPSGLPAAPRVDPLLACPDRGFMP